ncbi:MAG: 3-deoxy-7-phosphoheptulonate synthase [Ethanoligenens sp.]
MIVVLKNGVTKDKQGELKQFLEGFGVKVSVTEGTQTTILGLLGDTSSIDITAVQAQEAVDSVKRVQEPYKKANRKFHPDNTEIKVGDHIIGGKKLTVIAGPCSVECEEQIIEVAKRVKAAGATFLRGGAFKPRTSPYSFQGLHAEGLELLRIARKETGLPIVTEIMNTEDLDLFSDVDVIQVGARSMQNFELLKELGKTDKPILLKRGLANTYEEMLMSAEYIMSRGNEKVILCERGIRTYETFTRNTLDISAIPVLKRLSHLPIIIDPSHAAGLPWMVEPLSKASVAAGADGLMIEVHNNPAKALSDGAQSLTPDQFDGIMNRLAPLAQVVDRTL